MCYRDGPMANHNSMGLSVGVGLRWTAGPATLAFPHAEYDCEFTS
jgi:hypothetical protein